MTRGILSPSARYFISLAWLLPLPALGAASLGPPDQPPVAAAVPVEVPPVLDGDILNDPVWASVPPLTGFWQTTPNEGSPASERTEVRIVYTQDTLYFGVICYDRHPELIIVSDSRRDAPLTDTDSFQIILDTYHDGQNGFVFGTNPAGIEYDGQVTREGQEGSSGSRQRGGSAGGFNINWDGSWDVRARIFEQGWSAEFAIPFRTLRYPNADEQIWGLNLQRNIRRRNENSFWSPLPRQFNLYRLSRAGTLTGLHIPNQRNLKLMPYVLGQTRRRLAAEKTNWEGNSGFDVKYSLTPSLTLDATYNTDFAQVEVDEQQINLDRFNLFFPEKRPFFLENAGLFAVGDPGEVELFFSRRIGIGPAGRPIPILGGARLTGQLARTNVGFLSMQTERMGDEISANHFTVARVNRELPNRSSLGGIFASRRSTGSLRVEHDHNHVFAVDGRWGIGEYGQIQGFAAGSSTPELQGAAHAFRLGALYNSPAWRLEAGYTEVGNAFNPEVGFLRREGFRKPNMLVFHRFRPQSFLGLHEIRPHVSYRGYWNPRGFQETGFLHMDTHWEWKNGYEVHTGLNVTREGVVHPFEIYPGIVVPPGLYEHREAQLVANTNQGSWISFRFQTFIGGFFGGDRVAASPSMRLRVGDSFNTDVSLDRNDIRLPHASFATNLVRARVSYSFSPRTYVQTLLQYNNVVDEWSMNFRFGWLQAANTGLFIVYNDARSLLPGFTGFAGPYGHDRSLVIKFSRLFDLLD